MPEHQTVDEIRVPVRHPSEKVDDRTPSWMASRMGTWTRLMMLVFGIGPVLGSMFALGAAWAGGYEWLFEHEAIAWLGYPLILPFFTFAAIMLYAVLIANNQRITTGSKIAWLAAVTLVGPIAIPAYWWIHIWRAPHLHEPEHDA